MECLCALLRGTSIVIDMANEGVFKSQSYGGYVNLHIRSIQELITKGTLVMSFGGYFVATNPVSMRDYCA